MTYAIMIDGRPKFYRQPIHYNGQDIYTTDPRPYGYKEYIVPTAPQQEGYYAVADGWDETETQIIQRWRLEPIPEPEADISDYQEALNELGMEVDE